MRSSLLRDREEFNQNKIHPHIFALWVGLAGIIMMFGSLTSAYIVRRSAGNWLEFEIPSIFGISTAVIVLSSLALHASYYGFKNGKPALYRWFLMVTMVLAFVFIYFQYQGWEAMNAVGATFTANPSSSFIYVLSGLHVAHVLGGIGALVTAMVFAFMLPYAVTTRRLTRFKLVTNYWHFVGLVWVYLYFFILYI